jgi:hypothetical protein
MFAIHPNAADCALTRLPIGTAEKRAARYLSRRGLHMNRIFVLLVVLLLASCNASFPYLPDPNVEVPARTQAARQVFPDGKFRFVYVPSKGVGSDALNLGSLKSGAGSANSRALAEMLSANGVNQLRLAVSGPSDSGAALTLIDGLSRNKGRLGPAVEIAYVGGSEYLEEMKTVAAASGATLLHVQFPTP